MQNLQDNHPQIDTQTFKTDKQLENYKTIQNLYQQCGDHLENVNKTYEVELNEERDKNRALETRLSEMEKQVKHLLNVNREASAVMRSQELQLRFLRRQLEDRDQENREAKEVAMRSARKCEKMRRYNVRIRAEVETLRKRWREAESRGKFDGESEDDLDSVLQMAGDWRDSTLLGCGDYCDHEKKESRTETLPNVESFVSRRNDVTENKDPQNELPSGKLFLFGDNSIRDRKDTHSEQQQSGASFLSGDNGVCKWNDTQREVSSRESFLSANYSIRERKDTLSEENSRASFLSADSSIRERKDASFLSAARRVATPTGSDVTRPVLGSRGTHNRGRWGGETAILDILKEKSGSYGECGKDLIIDILKDLVTRECLERTAILDQRVATSSCLSSRVCSSCSTLLSDRENTPTPRQAEKSKNSLGVGEGSYQQNNSPGSKVAPKLPRPRNGKARRAKRSNHFRPVKREQNDRKPRQKFFGQGNSRLKNGVDCKKTRSPYDTWKKSTVKTKKKKSSKSSKKSCQTSTLAENMESRHVNKKATKCCKQKHDVNLRDKQTLKTDRKVVKMPKIKKNGTSPTRKAKRRKNGEYPTRSENKEDSTSKKTKSDLNGKTPATDKRSGNNLESPSLEVKAKEIVSHQQEVTPIHALHVGSKSSSSSSSKKKQHFSSHHINFRFSKKSTSVPSHILKPKSSLQSTYKSLQSTCKSAPSYVISPARLKVDTASKRTLPPTTSRSPDPLKRPNTAAHKKT